MSDGNKLVTETRTEFGKGAARRLRAAGKVPAVLYGHGTDPRHLALDGHDVFMQIRRANAILDLDIEGKPQIALVKDVQRNPVLQGVLAIEHLDLIVVKRGEKVTVDVPVHLDGESFAGTIPNHEATTLQIEVEALHIPDSIVVSIEGLEEGTQILAGAVELPKGATLLTDPEALVVGIITPQLEAELEEIDEAIAEAAAEAAAEAGEGESEESGEGDESSSDDAE